MMKSKGTQAVVDKVEVVYYDNNIVFAKAGLDNVTSAMCRHQQRLGLDIQFSTLVYNFNNIFLI